MIGALRGEVLSVGDETALIDVGGVGYEVSATPRHLDRLRKGEQVALAIETLVAETYIRLIAFPSADERASFRLLSSVQGVGAKAALAILHVLPTAALYEAISHGDKAAISKAQGVGPKLATRIITELKSKVDPLGALSGGDDLARSSATTGRAPFAGPRADAIAALMSLGYDEAIARRAVGAINPQAEESAETLIATALKSMAAA